MEQRNARCAMLLSPTFHRHEQPTQPIFRVTHHLVKLDGCSMQNAALQISSQCCVAKSDKPARSFSSEVLALPLRAQSTKPLHLEILSCSWLWVPLCSSMGYGEPEGPAGHWGWAPKAWSPSQEAPCCPLSVSQIHGRAKACMNKMNSSRSGPIC